MSNIMKKEREKLKEKKLSIGIPWRPISSCRLPALSTTATPQLDCPKSYYLELRGSFIKRKVPDKQPSDRSFCSPQITFYY